MSNKEKPLRTVGKAGCQYEGCEAEGFPCFMNAWDAEDGGDGPNGYWCSQHAPDAGFCACCGLFWGGIESFDFGNGICDNCRESEPDDCDEPDDYDTTEWLNGFDDYS